MGERLPHDPARAVEYFEAAAKLDYPPAWRELGICLGAGIGVTAAEFEDVTAAEYRLRPDDLYVRATAVSDRPARCRSSRHPEFESVWTQPFRRAAQ